ncbi:hypothetical protein EDC04DRAFT_887636 [Pisolithus marmoratus]|nr:hypothetical protein EDC04DRAFT_887636 [Pisolithus marmoratus]
MLPALCIMLVCEPNLGTSGSNLRVSLTRRSTFRKPAAARILPTEEKKNHVQLCVNVKVRFSGLVARSRLSQSSESHIRSRPFLLCVLGLVILCRGIATSSVVRLTFCDTTSLHLLLLGHLAHMHMCRVYTRSVTLGARFADVSSHCSSTLPHCDRQYVHNGDSTT